MAETTLKRLIGNADILETIALSFFERGGIQSGADMSIALSNRGQYRKSLEEAIRTLLPASTPAVKIQEATDEMAQAIVDYFHDSGTDYFRKLSDAKAVEGATTQTASPKGGTVAKTTEERMRQTKTQAGKRPKEKGVTPELKPGGVGGGRLNIPSSIVGGVVPAGAAGTPVATNATAARVAEIIRGSTPEQIKQLFEPYDGQRIAHILAGTYDMEDGGAIRGRVWRALDYDNRTKEARAYFTKLREGQSVRLVKGVPLEDLVPGNPTQAEFVRPFGDTAIAPIEEPKLKGQKTTAAGAGLASKTSAAKKVPDRTLMTLMGKMKPQDYVLVTASIDRDLLASVLKREGVAVRDAWLANLPEDEAKRLAAAIKKSRAASGFAGLSAVEQVAVGLKVVQPGDVPAPEVPAAKTTKAGKKAGKRVTAAPRAAITPPTAPVSPVPVAPVSPVPVAAPRPARTQFTGPSVIPLEGEVVDDVIPLVPEEIGWPDRGPRTERLAAHVVPGEGTSRVKLAGRRMAVVESVGVEPPAALAATPEELAALRGGPLVPPQSKGQPTSFPAPGEEPYVATKERVRGMRERAAAAGKRREALMASVRERNAETIAKVAATRGDKAAGAAVAEIEKGVAEAAAGAAPKAGMWTKILRFGGPIMLALGVFEIVHSLMRNASDDREKAIGAGMGLSELYGLRRQIYDMEQENAQLQQAVAIGELGQRAELENILASGDRDFLSRISAPPAYPGVR